MNTRGLIEMIAWPGVMLALFIAMMGAHPMVETIHPRDDAVLFTDEEKRIILSHALAPLPPDPTNRYADDPGVAHFGQYLFFETRFSANNAVSCATCHDPKQGFSDGRALGRGISDVSRHTMSLWNIASQRWFFWDGRADSLWMQALEPFEDPREFGSDRVSVIRAVHEDDALRTAYEAHFGLLPPLDDRDRFPTAARPMPDEPDHDHHRNWLRMSEHDREAVNRAFVNLGKSLAAYQRRLVLGNSPFDRFIEQLRGGAQDEAAPLNASAQRGLRLFIGPANCRACHFGPSFTDGEFHNNGIPPRDGAAPTDPARHGGIARLLANPFNSAGPYSDDPDGPTARRLRRLVHTAEQWGRFKTPGLRQVADSPPYMHAGQFATLEDVIRFYSTLDGQVLVGHHHETILQPLHLSEAEISDLAAFLRSLSGTPDQRLLEQPAHPLMNNANPPIQLDIPPGIQ